MPPAMFGAPTTLIVDGYGTAGPFNVMSIGAPLQNRSIGVGDITGVGEPLGDTLGVGVGVLVGDGDALGVGVAPTHGPPRSSTVLIIVVDVSNPSAMITRPSGSVPC